MSVFYKVKYMHYAFFGFIRNEAISFSCFCKTEVDITQLILVISHHHTAVVNKNLVLKHYKTTTQKLRKDLTLGLKEADFRAGIWRNVLLQI